MSPAEKRPPTGKPRKPRLTIHLPVFVPSLILVVAFVSVTLIVGPPMETTFAAIQSAISHNAGWFFVWSVNIFLVFVLFTAFSRFGRIRLGGADAKPEFSTTAWFAMLFSAGMGIGILFWSVAEPVFHFIDPPIGEGGTIQAARDALAVTYLHWGLHAWAIYALVGMALAFFAFNRGLPLTVRSVFYPVLGKRIYGPIGDLVDVVAVVATLFGLATSLGLGVTQIGAGLAFLTGLADDVTLHVILIVIITLIAVGSVALGIHRGVKVLSQMNIYVAGLLLLFMVIVGPTLFIMSSFVQNTGYYLQNILELSFWTESYAGTDWQDSWTIFYWAWWISWSPFVGMFIARISRGRTVREFVLGVLLVPSLLTFLWLAAFGGTAVLFELQGIGNIAAAVEENISTALFVLLNELPLAMISSGIAVLLIASFFVTSSDSGSLVIDSIMAGGVVSTPVYSRVFWACMEGLLAGVLLIGGGLTALQTAAIISGLPFTLVLLLMCYSLYRGLSLEAKREQIKEEEKYHESYEETLSEVVESRSRRKQKNTS